MILRIYKGEEEIKTLPLEGLDFIGALKFIPPNLKAKRCEIEALEDLIQALKGNKLKMEENAEYVPINILADNSEKQIPFGYFLDEIINMLQKLIELYSEEGVEVVID